MYINKNKFGKKIIELRELHNMTQKTLAKKIDTTIDRLDNIESRGSRPSLYLLQKISEVFEIDVIYLRTILDSEKLIMLPIYDKAILNQKINNNGEIFQQIEMPTSALDKEIENYFFIKKINDDLKYFGIYKGDLLLFYKLYHMTLSKIENNKFYLISYFDKHKDNVFIRQIIEKDDQIILQAHNDTYKNIVVTNFLNVTIIAELQLQIRKY